jgi:signal transduction histidine kinase/CheY-like chemotaxis protein
MQGSKMVVLVPDAAARERVRAVASGHPISGLHASVHVAHDRIDVCVRDTRRSLFDGPLAVLSQDEPSSLLALGAGADEAFSLDSFTLDGRSWARLVDRTRLKAETRRESAQRLTAVSELERLCALGRLVSGVADELGGPLNNALLALDLLQRELDPLYATMARLRELAASGLPVDAHELAAVVAHGRVSAGTPLRARQVLGDISDTCEAIAQVTSDLGLRDLGLHKLAPDAEAHERHEYVNLREALDKILRLFRRAADKNTHIERDYADDLPDVLVPRARLAQVLISLLANALASVGAVQRDVHRVRLALRADDSVVTVTISDTGLGLGQHVLHRIFDATAPSPSEQDASGLELSVARATMRALGGDLMVESVRGEGATFVAWLPRPKQRDARISGTVPKPDFSAESRRTVLIVEPNRHVLSALSRLLRERYDVLLALSGTEARELVRGGSKPDAIVTGVHEPESLAFVEWLLLERADLSRRLLLTTDLAEPTGLLTGLPYLEKPIEPAALFRGIEARFIAPLHKARPAAIKASRLVKRG